MGIDALDSLGEALEDAFDGDEDLLEDVGDIAGALGIPMLGPVAA